MADPTPLASAERQEPAATAERARLRELRSRGTAAEGNYRDLAADMAPRLLAELEAAEAECRWLRNALQGIADHDSATCNGIMPSDCLETCQEIARASLAKESSCPDH